ncbi:MAG: sugar ABC transporter ATP-binding protein [Kiritimatiellia bacterium]|jgi:ABC-type sugar transport system ATPase subunit|nr:sugar ABC transporter ATP-binding protein [Kiritimatiellia bacterium]
MNNKVILKMEGMCQAFPGVQALEEVGLEVYKGEVLGLVGKNGAGKSTLVRILMGLQTPDAGTITIDGKSYERMASSAALQAGVAYVPQIVNVMDSLSVAENILAGDMPVSRLGLVDWKEVYREAESRLARLGLNLDVRKPAEGLKVAEKTMLAIAKALFGDTKLIILDECTAPLPHADIELLFDFIKSLEGQGVAFIYISHHLEEVFEICDRVTVLRDGLGAGTYQVADLDMDKLAHLIAGEDVKEYERFASAIKDRPVLKIEGLTRRGSYEDIDLVLHEGEVVGLSGLQGCGAEDLAAGLFGMERRGVGSVTINGRPLTARNPKEAFSQGLALLPQDRNKYGMVGLRPVRENVTYTVLDRIRNFLGVIWRKKEESIVDGYIESLGIKTPSREELVRQLSGGNQQKVVFAKLAAVGPSVLVLHEPTTGVDIRAKQDIFKIVDDLASKGSAILVISSKAREQAGICDRVIVMYKGRIVKEFHKGDSGMTPENIVRAIEGEGYDE